MDYRSPWNSKMAKTLLVLCIIVAIQVCLAYEVAVPVFKEPYGLIEPRISQGQIAARGQFPHTAIITVYGFWICGGSLISKNWVLTAARCTGSVPIGAYYVTLGAWNFFANDEPGRITIASEYAVTHEDYNSETLENNIGLIGLPTDVELSDTINVIKLPPKSYQNQNFAGQTVRFSGWGRTEDGDNVGVSKEQLFIDLTIITLEECKAVYGDTIFSTQYCAKGVDKQGICGTDGGGPLTIGSGENLTQLGVGSFVSSRGCAKGFPSGFTAIPFYLDWISEKTGIPINDF